MNSIGRHCNYKEICYDEETCRKISLAIKKSKIFAHIKPMDLLKEKLGINENDENVFESIPPCKKVKVQNTRNYYSPIKSTLSGNITLLPTPDVLESTPEPILPVDSLVKDIELLPKSQVDAVKTLNTSSPRSSSPLNVSQAILPKPESLFENAPTVIENAVGTDNKTDSSDVNMFNEEYLKTKDDILEKFADVNKSKATKVSFISVPEKFNRNDKFREKQKKNLFSLATSLLPVPSQLYDKDSLIAALTNSDIFGFIDILKEVLKLEDQLSPKDLSEVLDVIIELKALSVLPEICSCLEFKSSYSESLSNSFIKYNEEMKNYHEDILNCLSSMLDPEIILSITSFIKACYCVNDWNKMWTRVLETDPEYKFDEYYFKACMAVFQNINNNSAFITHDTMLTIIKYIMKHYGPNYEMLMADIWLYCILTTETNSETDLKVPVKIMDKVIDKLVVMKNPSFLFIMKLLCKNWALLSNTTFVTWLSQLIAEKGDVKQCLLSLKESVDLSYEEDPELNNELNNNFLLLSLHVMSFLNKRFLFTCSKKIYETFLENNLDGLKNLLLERVDKFKYKWIIVDCLVSSSDYQKALKILKDFDVLRDLEVTFVEYESVREKLPNLVWHLLGVSNISEIIDLFEQVMSIFLFNEKNDKSYIKNCSEIFHLIIIKVYDSNDQGIVKRILSLLDLILSSDVEFSISKESLRYLLVIGVRTEVPFAEMLDLIDQCFKLDIFEPINTADDGFGSFVRASSSLTEEEVVVLVSWLCRHVKVRLVELAQSEGASVRGNLMKVCNLKFILHAAPHTDDEFANKVGKQGTTSLADLAGKFTGALTSPRYLSHPIKYVISGDPITADVVTVVCENRVVYNAIYYSDI